MTIEDDTPQCGREDSLEWGRAEVVRCSLPEGHDGPHAFVHTWTDPRDDARR